METLARPSWSAIWRAESSSWSSRVAQVLRNTWLVTQVNSPLPRASRSSRDRLKGSRQPPRLSGKSGPVSPVATRRRSSMLTANSGRGQRAVPGVGLGAANSLEALALDAQHLVVEQAGAQPRRRRPRPQDGG